MNSQTLLQILGTEFEVGFLPCISDFIKRSGLTVRQFFLSLTARLLLADRLQVSTAQPLALTDLLNQKLDRSATSTFRVKFNSVVTFLIGVPLQIDELVYRSSDGIGPRAAFDARSPERLLELW